MCGIAGFYKTRKDIQAPFDAKSVSFMQGVRGPDGTGSVTCADGLVGLFHQRLSIIDLSDLGKQPMTSSCQKCGAGIQLIYNGELYNYRELKSELINLGHVFHSSSDTEVIIHAYTQYGLDAFAKFNGVFSLALFDGRSNTNSETIKTNDLIVVRDPIGVKPLYYTANETYFGFASELKTLLLDTKLPRDLDHQALNDYLTYLWCPAPRTPLKAVKKLEPGCFLLVREGGIIKHHQYYDIPLKRKDEVKGTKVKDLIEETKDKVELAVKRQMVSDVPIGAFLSGGLDSSAIVACMRKLEPDINIDCYTIKSTDEGNEGFVSDFKYAQKVAKHLNVKLNTVEISDDVYKHLPTMIYHLDEPQADIAPINAYLIAKSARDMGYKVLMSGAGGDDIFTGYRRHYALSLEKYWQFLPKSILNGMSHFSGNMNSVTNPLMRRFVKLFSHCNKDFDNRLVSYFDWSNESVRKELFSKKQDYEYSMLSSLQSISKRDKISPQNLMLYMDCKHFLADHNLNYTDKMTMACGIETRVPLLDLELIEHAFSLPDRVKQRGNIGKFIFKKSMESYLPHEVIYRPKTGFGAPLRSWLDKGMKAAVDELLCESSVRSRGIFDYDAIKNLREQNLAGKIDASYIILAVFNIELWCRTFIDQAIPGIVDLF